MLSDQDTRAVVARGRCNMELDDLCDIFPTFEREDISAVIQAVSEEKIGIHPDMHSVSMNCS